MSKRQKDSKTDKQCAIQNVMPRILYGEDWEGNKYEPEEIKCIIDDNGKHHYQTKELLGVSDMPLDLEVEYEA